MARAISRSDLAGASPVFYLAVTWGGREYRFSSLPITVTKNDGSTLAYDGGLPDPDYETSLDMLEGNPEGGAIPVEVVFPLDLIEQLMKYGRSLDSAVGELGMYTERGGAIVQTYEDRIRLFSGSVMDPIIGDPDRPIGYVTFSIERRPDLAPDLIVAPKTVITRAEFALTDGALLAVKAVTNSIGKNWPVVIGAPGAGTEQPGIAGGVNSYDQPGSPAYFIKCTKGTDAHNQDTVVELLIAAGDVVALTVGIRDYTGRTATGLAVSAVQLADGREYSKISFSYTADGLFHPWLKVIAGLSIKPEFAIAETDDPKYWVIWDDGGGMINPYGSGAITGAGDLLRFGLETTNVDIDQQSWSNVSGFLNRYRFAGFVIDGDVSWWDWIQDNLLPWIPLHVVNGPDGLRAVLPLLYMANYALPRVTATTGPGFAVVSALEPLNEISDLLNELRIAYAFEPQGENLSNRLDVQGYDSLQNSAFEYSTEIATISRNRYGRRSKEVEIPHLYKLHTAAMIADYLIARDALIVRDLIIEADPEWGWLQPGDVVALTSTEYFLAGHRVQLLSKAWTGESWNFRFLLADNPALNTRI